MDRKKITIPDLMQKKAQGQKVTMLTAYDYPTARVMDQAGVDAVLVGDSLGMVVLGYDSTVPVTMDEMLHHIKAVRRGLTYPLLIGDMPFMSYQVSKEQAIANAGRMMKEGGCDCVKLEGGAEVAPTVKAIVQAGIPVCAHIGLTPQSVAQLGGYKVQGKDLAGAQKLIEAAGALAEAGASLVVFECIPAPLAEAITKATPMVTIGIGGGAGCDGQVLVIHDLVGLAERKPPKMARQYANIFPVLNEAVSTYVKEVTSGAFPAPEHGFAMDPAVLAQLKL
ncbi:MAG: 3-methyl-2-oxobutanoate hydroxymethyltransferase [Desulfarculus sp.]|jgi:3-methyl-2-oxobutanoate hydroxymethyltransferase|nr:MAG: 3-methyl-2-oxobutanoate hydroxymethyltransferase [Desulfarculus sp.]